MLRRRVAVLCLLASVLSTPCLDGRGRGGPRGSLHAGGSLLVGRTAEADEDDDAVGLRARLIHEFLVTGRDASARELAASPDPDPWLVAEALLAVGNVKSAERFAALVPGRFGGGRAAPRGAHPGGAIGRAFESAATDLASIALGPTSGTLSAYVRRRRGASKQGELRGILSDAYERLSKGQAKFALGLVRAAEIEADTVLWIQSRLLMAEAHAALGEHGAEGDDLAAAAAASGRIGWWARSQEMWTLAGDVAFRNSDCVLARERYEGGLLVLEWLDDPDTPQAIPNALVGVAAMAGGSSNLEVASRSLIRAVGLFRKIPDPYGEATALVDLATVDTRLGRYSEALSLLDDARRAAARHARSPAARSTKGTAFVEGVLYDIAQAAGVIETQIDRHPEARTLYEEALRHAKSAGDVPAVGLCYGNLGVALIELAKAARARGDSRQADELFQASLRAQDDAIAYFESLKDWARVAQAQGNAAVTIDIAGDPRRAMVYAKAGLETLESLVRVGDPLALEQARGEYARLLRKNGRATEALALHLRALDTVRALGARAEAARMWSGIAEDRLALGDPAGALEAAKSDLLETNGTVAGLSDQQGIAARQTAHERSVVGIQAAATLGDEEDLTRFLEGGRAGALMEAMGVRAISTAHEVAAPPALAALERQTVGEEAKAYESWMSSLGAGDRRETTRRGEALEIARAAVRDVVDRIQRAEKSRSNLVYPRPDGLAEVKASLREGEILVLYALDEGEALAQVIDRDGARHVALGPTKAIEAACGRLATPDRTGVVVSEIDAVRALLVDPLHLPKDARRILVSPDGPIGYLPLALLLPDRSVAFVPSGTVLGLLRHQPSTGGEGILAYGDPDYAPMEGTQALAIMRGMRRLPSLPASRLEVEAFGDVKRLGSQATEAMLRTDLAGGKGRFRAIHLAGHGHVELAKPLGSSIALSPSGDDDGFLTVVEVLRMRIPADLVVLSACESGGGAYARGEGIVGLTRAFMFAGVPRVIASLWKVDDQATMSFMIEFYAAWKKGAGPADALRSAQTRVRDDPSGTWQDPRFWAAWVLWGLPE